MGETDAFGFENSEIGFIDPDGVRGDGAAIEDAEIGEGFGGGDVALGEALVVLVLRFGKMNQKRRLVFVGESAAGLQGFVGIGVDGVRGDGRNDQRIAVEAGEIAIGEGQRIGGRFGIGTGKPMMVSPSTPRMPASLAASATTSSK